MDIITPAKIEKMAKVGALTTSPSDGEALAAIRRLNGMMAAAGLDWPHLFNCCATVTGGPSANPAAYSARQWRAAFRECWAWRAFLPDRDRVFLEGVEGLADISPKQHDWLRDVYRKAAVIAAREARECAA